MTNYAKIDFTLRQRSGIKDGTSNTFMIGEIPPGPPKSGHECLVFYLGGIPGLSPSGVHDFAAGRIVTNQDDRRLLANAMLLGIGFTAAEGTSLMALLLPAVQAAREAAKHSGEELSTAGAIQFFSGDAVASPQDRIALATVMADSPPVQTGGWILDASRI